MEGLKGLSALKTIYASKRPTGTKPAWRMACMGLNVEGKCENAQCEAYASRVRCQMGFGVFKVADAALCPICQWGIMATRIGLIGCQWMIEGDQWRESSCEEYLRFCLEGARQHSLIVTTQALASNQVTDMEHDAGDLAEGFGTLSLTTSKL